MRSLKRSWLVVLGLVLLGLALSTTNAVQAVGEKISDVFVTNDAAHAVPVTLGNPRALRRLPSELVSLTHHGASNSFYHRQLATGESESAEFQIPTGKVLVITDIEVTFRHATEPGAGADFFLQSDDATGTAIRARLRATLDAEGAATVSTHYESGIVVASTATLFDNLDPDDGFDVATVRGYLDAND